MCERGLSHSLSLFHACSLILYVYQRFDVQQKYNFQILSRTGSIALDLQTNK